MYKLHRHQINLLILFIVFHLLAAVVYAFMPGGALAVEATFGQTTDLAPW